MRLCSIRLLGVVAAVVAGIGPAAAQCYDACPNNFTPWAYCSYDGNGIPWGSCSVVCEGDCHCKFSGTCGGGGGGCDPGLNAVSGRTGLVRAVVFEGDPGSSLALLGSSGTSVRTLAGALGDFRTLAAVRGALSGIAPRAERGLKVVTSVQGVSGGVFDTWISVEDRPRFGIAAAPFDDGVSLLLRERDRDVVGPEIARATLRPGDLVLMGFDVAGKRYVLAIFADSFDASDPLSRPVIEDQEKSFGESLAADPGSGTVSPLSFRIPVC